MRFIAANAAPTGRPGSQNILPTTPSASALQSNPEGIYPPVSSSDQRRDHDKARTDQRRNSNARVKRVSGCRKQLLADHAANNLPTSRRATVKVQLAEEDGRATVLRVVKPADQ